MNERLHLECEGRGLKKELEMSRHKTERKLRGSCVRKSKRRSV